MKAYTLKEKLEKLQDEGKFRELMGELRHYLGTLSKHARSPLVVDLLAMFKMAIDKDIEALDDNLVLLETLFNTPGLDVQVEILDVFSRLSTIPSLRQSLFDRYFKEIQDRFLTMPTSVRVMIIEILENLSRDMPTLQGIVIAFLLGHLDGAEHDVLIEILAVFQHMLTDEPDVEATFEPHCQRLLDRYAFESDATIEGAFIELFKFLPRSKDEIIQTCLHWLKSRDYHLKHKGLKILPAVVESRVDMECLATLLDGLKDKDAEFESSVVDALSSIMARNPRFYITRALKYARQLGATAADINGLVDLANALAGKDFESIFSCVFETMSIADGACDALSLAILNGLNEEYPRQLYAAIFKIMESFDAMRPGGKLAILDKILAVATGLKSEIISVWFAKYLSKLATDKEGEEIQRKASIMIARLRALEANLDEKLEHVNVRIKQVEDNISTMKNYPRLLRERASIFTDTGDRDSATRMLEAEYRSLLQKIIDFDDFISKLEFKHLIMDLVDEWYQAKEYILDDLNTVKDYIAGRIDKVIKEKHADIGAAIQRLVGKKEVVLAEYEELRSTLERIDSLDDGQMGDITGKIARFTTNMLLFDLEASKMLIEQPVSIGGYQAFLESWVQSREQMERDLEGGIAAIDRWIDKTTRGKESVAGNTERTVTMYKFFSSFVHSSIQDFRTILDEFQSRNEQSTSDFFSRKFEDIEKAISFKQSKLLDLIENKAYLIDKYWRALNQATRDIEFIVTIGRLKEEWLTTKENIEEKIRRYYHAQLERIDAEKIKQMLRIINPIPIGSLKSRLKSIQCEDDVRYIAGVIDIVQRHQINALVQNNMLVSVRDYNNPDLPGAPVRIKTTASPHDAFLALKVIVENTSIHELYDVIVSIKLPAVIGFHDPGRSNHRKSTSSIESGKNATFTWDLEDIGPSKPDPTRPAIQLSKIAIIVSGKIPVDRHFSKTEELCFIYK
ncbi:MAG: hypothetical protein GYA24_03475 [Candidatus Lokiarchaeota archaeon]|nr:hypothetical protein [Candidatus Lokiarchaeota archaeon]